MSPSPIRSLSTPPSGWKDETVALAGAPGAAVRVYGCESRTPETPLILHFHAGAFVGGSLEGGLAVGGALAAAGATVASLDYPLAPTHPFPQAAEAGYAALQWLERQRRRLAHAGAPIFIAGEEAGGNLAAAVAMIARDRGGPEVAGQILLSPMLDVCIATESQRQAKAGHFGCPWADGWRAYLPRAQDATHPYAAPGAALRLGRLPRTLLITAQDDPLRDETQAYAKRLRAAGVAVELTVLPGPTGWPRSYLQSDSTPWAAALRERVQPFLFQPAQQPQRTTLGSHP